MRLLVTRRMPDAVTAAARARFDVVTRDVESQVLSPDELRAALRDFDVVMPTLGDRFSADVFADVPTPRCRLLANFLAAAVEVRSRAARGLLAGRPSKANRAHRLIHRAAIRPGNARYRYSHIGIRRFGGSFGHFTHSLFTYCAKLQ